MTDPRFTAKPPRSSTSRYFWVLALIVIGLLAYLKPWAAPTPLVFRLRPLNPTAADAAPSPNAVSVQIIPSQSGTASGAARAPSDRRPVSKGI